MTPIAVLADHLAAVERRIVDDDVHAARRLAGGLEAYVASCSTPESPALAKLARRTEAREWEAPLEAEMLSGHPEGRLLAFLAGLIGARRALEIGMFTGYAALALAEALPADGEVVACELDDDVAAFARAGFADSAAGARIRVEVGSAGETLRRLAERGETFDLVFLDADKAGYWDYLDVVLDTGLLAERGLVCVDNTLMQGEPWAAVQPSANGAAIADFNARLAADERTEQVLLPLRDGITLVRRSR